MHQVFLRTLRNLSVAASLSAFAASQVSEAVRNFQSSYRGYFVGSAEEFTHSQKQATACTLVVYLLQDNLVRNV